MTFVAFSDASFACRNDLSSQGGFLLLMVNKDVANGEEGHYNVIDWRSWKLARVARSTLSAESQAASEAADALLFTNTFWSLLWRPWQPLDRVETARLAHSPKLVVDAKALYDMLIRTEVQATSGTDKRTAIEVLVTQDKLNCCMGKTLWTSSERQYADGLTKDSASQLLADRLRTHLMKLKSDLTFQASKKKTPQERKENAEMYAVKKPQRAMATMIAMILYSNCQAHDINLDTNIITENPNDLNTFDIALMLFVTIMIAFAGHWMIYGLRNLGNKLLRAMRTPAPEPEPEAEEETLEEDSNPATVETSVQTDLGMHDVVPMTQYWEETQQMIYEMQHNFVPLHVHEDRVDSLSRDLDRAHELSFRRTQNPIYFTMSGRCWHADRECLRRRSTTQIIEKNYCTQCCFALGNEEAMLQPNDG